MKLARLVVMLAAAAVIGLGAAMLHNSDQTGLGLAGIAAGGCALFLAVAIGDRGRDK